MRLAIREVASILSGIAMAAVLCLSAAKLQGKDKSLTKDDVLNLLTGDVPPERVASVARDRGVAFEMTRATEKQFRDAGADEELLKVLRELAPKPLAPPAKPPESRPPSAGPPVLMIEAMPGGAQVYLDDEPIGTTSPKGVLKYTRLAPGSHRVRLSLAGYEDHEETVQLVAGETAQVSTTLQAATAPAAPPPVGGSEPQATQNANPGYLGILPVASQPTGARGVVISGADPGGPADRAGIQVYDTVLRIGGQPVRTPQELQAAVARHQAGEVVEVTWLHANQTITRSIQLTARPSGSVPATTANPSSVPATPSMPASMPGVVFFSVMHDHGSGGTNYCVGVMAIGNGVIQYRSTTGIHSFIIPLNEVKEAKRNGVYLVAMGGFHIRLQKGTNYNFVAITPYGQYQPPDMILTAIDRATGQR